MDCVGARRKQGPVLAHSREPNGAALMGNSSRITHTTRSTPRIFRLPRHDPIHHHPEISGCGHRGRVHRLTAHQGGGALGVQADDWPIGGECALTNESAEQVGWVIERYHNSTLFYWNGRSSDGFTGDIKEAIRFARDADASTVLGWLLDGHGRVAQHMWCPPA